jgi:hypothetical protein
MKKIATKEKTVSKDPVSIFDLHRKERKQKILLSDRLQ